MIDPEIRIADVACYPREDVERAFLVGCFCEIIDVPTIPIGMQMCRKDDINRKLIKDGHPDAAVLLVDALLPLGTAIDPILQDILVHKDDVPALSVRLEIAQFLQNQEAAIDQYLKGIIERVEETGKAKTKSLDGVLVKIALEKLREKFPDKYVSVKSNSDGQFVVVNDFIKK